MSPRLIGLGLVLIDTVFTSAAQVCFKLGASRLDGLGLHAFGEPWIVIGLVLQVAMLPVLLAAYKRGEVVVFFPLLSLSHVWNTFAGVAWLGEVMTPPRWAGTALIILGSATLAWSRERT